MCGDCVHLSQHLHLESLLLSLEVTETSTVGGASTAATGSATSTAVTESTTGSATATTATASASTAVTEATTSSTATSTSTTGITLWAWGSVIETDWASSDISTHHVLHGGLSILNRLEGNVSEALWVSGVPMRY